MGTLIIAPGGGGEEKFDSDITVTLSPGRTFGKYPNASIIPATGKTAREVILDATVEYLYPAVSSFDITDEASVVETGYRVTGSTTFGWAFSNTGNITPNTVTIKDVTSGNIVLGSALSIVSPTAIVLPMDIYKNAPGQSHVWSIEAQNTLAGTFSGTTNIVWRNRLFYGTAASTPVTSADVRALANNPFYSGATTFILNTGLNTTRFQVVLPPGKSITNVIDLTALNAVITTQYVLLGTIDVDDVGTPANTFQYNLYEMTIATPWVDNLNQPVNHQHQITIN